jgi:ATP-dependent RNA helicase RhlE
LNVATTILKSFSGIYMSFENLGLSEPLLRAVKSKGYSAPTPIQEQSIPAVLKKTDLMACAQTGTGKTAGFTLPILELLSRSDSHESKHPSVLILAPTRELAAQIHQSILDYSVNSDIRSFIVFGGVKIGPQISKLRQGVDILVATPGRLLDLFNQRAVRLNEVKTLVLDEADRMLDMGFINDIKKIINLMPKDRQNLLFSATFSNEIRKLAKGLLKNPAEINITPKNTAAQTVQHKVHPVDKGKKSALLSHLISKHKWFQALVFTRTKHGANNLVKYLSKNNIQALAIHGNKSQNQRTKALESFKAGKVQILVATDIAARGIDIAQLPQVVNFDLPNIAEDYVHRIGRTGRAGSKGQAISLVSADEVGYLLDIQKLLKNSIEREYVEGYEPTHELPTTAPRKGPASKKPTGRNNSSFGARGRTGKPSGRRNASPNGRSGPKSNSSRRQPSGRRG